MISTRPRVTNARGGESPHNNEIAGKPAALAFDVVFGSRKKVYWNGPWWVLGKIARMFSLEWGGSWKQKDCPHFQDPAWKSISQIISPE